MASQVSARATLELPAIMIPESLGATLTLKLTLALALTLTVTLTLALTVNG